MAVDKNFFLDNLSEAYNMSAVWTALDSWYRLSETAAVTSWGYALLYYNYIASQLNSAVEIISAFPIVKSLISPMTVSQMYAFLCGVCVMCSVLVWVKIVLTSFDKRKPQELDPVKESIRSFYDVFDLAKTAYQKGHTEAVIKEVESRSLDINMPIPTNGLSLFMCACLSGHRRLIQYMIEQGGDPHCTSSQGDSPFYLATYGILNSPKGSPDFGVLDELIDAGCPVNKPNHRGYTPLHRAASKGDLPLVKYLLTKGADPYRCSNSGIYPIDSAVTAGHIEVAQALRIDVANPHVWDVIEPHTPPHISLGLMSPHRRLMLESPAPRIPQMTLR